MSEPSHFDRVVAAAYEYRSRDRRRALADAQFAATIARTDPERLYPPGEPPLTAAEFAQVLLDEPDGPEDAEPATFADGVITGLLLGAVAAFFAWGVAGWVGVLS